MINLKTINILQTLYILSFVCICLPFLLSMNKVAAQPGTNSTPDLIVETTPIQNQIQVEHQEWGEQGFMSLSENGL